MILATCKRPSANYLHRGSTIAAARLLPKTFVLCFAFLLNNLFINISAIAEESRTWTSADGTQQIEAEFIAVKADSVQLKTPNGKTVSIPLEKFSQADRDYLTQVMAQSMTESVAGNDSGGTPIVPITEMTSAIENEELRSVAAQLGIETHNGLPVIRDDWRSRDPEKSSQALALSKLFDRIAISVSSEFSETVTPAIIANHFPKRVAQKFLSQHQYFARTSPLLAARTSRWKGDDEFATRATQKDFFEKHRQDLENLGVRLPGRFLFVSKVFFNPYDFQRGGMVFTDYGSFDELTGQFAVLASVQSTQGYVRYVRSPARLQPFWTVQPDTVRKLESVNNRRVAYLVQDVSLFVSPTRKLRPEGFLPPLEARVNSVNLYADEKLTQPVGRWEVNQFPQAVLLSTTTEKTLQLPEALPLDEFTIAGLLKQHTSADLAEGAWIDLWNEQRRIDIEKYVVVNDAIKEEASSHSFISRLNTEPQTIGRSDESAKKRKAAEDAITFSVEKINRLMSIHNRPFFPPQPANSGTATQLQLRHRTALEEWIMNRVALTNNRFFFLAKIGYNQELDQPEFLAPSTGVSPRLKEEGFDADRTLRMGNKMTIENRFHPVKWVRSFDEHRFREDFLRIGENRGTAISLAFKSRVDHILQVIPQKLLNELYDDERSDYQRAAQVEFKVDRLELIKSREKGGTDELVIHLSPTYVRLFHHRRLLFEKEYKEPTRSQMTESMDTNRKVPSSLSGNPMKSGDDPLIPKPDERTSHRSSSSSTEVQELTPAMIPLMIAKFQPDFFNNHLDQFVVTRLQHEHWFRTNPTKNIYGVDKSLGEALPIYSNMPDTHVRKTLTTKLKTWSDKHKESTAGPFTLRFDAVEFKHAILQTTPSPAFFQGMHYDSPFYSKLFNPIHDAESALSSERSWVKNKELSIAAGAPLSNSVKAEFAKQKEHVVEWEKAMMSPPREIYFSTRRFQFVIPDSNGNREIRQQGVSMGGRSSGGITGIPIAKPTTEPIFPVLSIDKEIWLPENAAIEANGDRLLLEVTLDPKDVKILDQPAPHPWIEATMKYASSSYGPDRLGEYRSKCDAGQYAMIYANLQAARIVNVETGATVLQLDLRESQRTQ